MDARQIFDTSWYHDDDYLNELMEGNSWDYDDACMAADEFMYDDFEALCESISKRLPGNLVVFGTRGLWYGKVRTAGTVKDFMGFIGRFESCDDMQIAISEDGDLYIEVHHHDGRNSYVVREWKADYPEEACYEAMDSYVNGDGYMLDEMTNPLGKLFACFENCR